MTIIIKYTVKLGLDGLSPAELVERARAHVIALTGNLTYATPVPALGTITAAADALEAADIAVQQNGGKLDYLARKERMKELKDLLKELGGYVQAISKGDPEKIASAGFGTRKLPEPVGAMTAPPNLRARITDMLGEIDLRWGRVFGRMIYVIWYCMGDPLVEENWKLLTMSSKNFYTVKGLDSRKTYTFRVVAEGAAGPGPASDIAAAQPL